MLLAGMMVFTLFAALQLTAGASDGPFRVTLQPVGATYTLNQVAVPLTTTFVYDGSVQNGYIDPDAPMKVTWYWSATNSNTGRINSLGESPVSYDRTITHIATQVPATNAVGVRYYYAVLTYSEHVVNANVWSSIPREAVSDPARIEVVASAHGFRVRKVDEKGDLLSGAVLQLVPNSEHDQDPSVVPHEAITVGGYASFNATEGFYILSEKQAPTGYNPTDDKYYIFIGPDGVYLYVPGTNTFGPYELVTFVNKPIPGLNKDDHNAYMQGYPGSRFLPTRNMTRAEAVVMFCRLLSEKMDIDGNHRNDYYPDFPPTAWYANEVGYMQELGVLVDFSRDGRFRGNDPVTRAEFAVLAARFDDLEYTDVNKFPDVPDDHWAVKYINSAEKKGWIEGYTDGTFRPDANMIRQNVVMLVNRMLERDKTDTEYLKANMSSLPRTYVDVPTTHWAFGDIMESSIRHNFTRDSAGDEHWTAVFPD